MVKICPATKRLVLRAVEGLVSTENETVPVLIPNAGGMIDNHVAPGDAVHEQEGSLGVTVTEPAPPPAANDDCGVGMLYVQLTGTCPAVTVTLAVAVTP
jgi:hypothetical protein